MQDTYPTKATCRTLRARSTPQNTTIVVSRWQGDTSWTQRLAELGYRVCVYDHNTNSNNPFAVPINRGTEASAYLKYIHEYYDNLTLYTIFVHDSEFSWHHEGSLLDIILNKLTKLCAPKYVNFNNKCTGSIHNGWWPEIRKFFDKYLAPQLGPRKLYGDWTLGNRCCAQFIVHRDRIHKHPKAFYKKLYDFTLAETNDPKKHGHFLEWTYALIFDSPVLYPKGKRIKKERAASQACPQPNNGITSRMRL